MDGDALCDRGCPLALGSKVGEGVVCSLKTEDMGKKKGYLSQTANLFVNLKSNTMKNTLQRYGFWGELQTLGAKNLVI